MLSTGPSISRLEQGEVKKKDEAVTVLSEIENASIFVFKLGFGGTGHV
jgi:hypothetical protein